MIKFDIKDYQPSDLLSMVARQSRSPSLWYVARDLGPLPRLTDAVEIEKLAHQVLTGEPIEEHKRWLIAPGSTLGGARPKALLNLDGQQWMLKFTEDRPFLLDQRKAFTS